MAGRFSAIASWHENDALIARVQGIPGALILWAAASALFWWLGSGFILTVALALVMVLPSRRRGILSLAAIGVLAERLAEFPADYLPASALSSSFIPLAVAAFAVAAGVAALYVVFFLARNFSRWPAFAQRHPVLTVQAGIWMVLCLATFPGFGFLGLATYFAWRFSYLAVAASRGTLAGTRFSDQLFWLSPVYGGTNTPYGKGLDFLARHEADNAASMARSQLAGIKLLLLAVAWTYVREVMDIVFFGMKAYHLAGWPTDWMNGWTFNLRPLKTVVASGVPPVWYLTWAGIYLELIRATLSLAIMGHSIVGGLRLLGFNVFRNTYKPLLSTSVLEFWNRYYYYFKEVLVDFFFFPTYLRLRALPPAARMFAAVFAAAFIGNMYYHLMLAPKRLIRFDVEWLWDHWSSRLVYCLVLAAGIWVSMMRQQKLRAQNAASGAPLSGWTRIRRIAGVWTFFSIIHIWNVDHTGAGIRHSARVFLSLFGF